MEEEKIDGILLGYQEYLDKKDNITEMLCIQFGVYNDSITKRYVGYTTAKTFIEKDKVNVNELIQNIGKKCKLGYNVDVNSQKIIWNNFNFDIDN